MHSWLRRRSTSEVVRDLTRDGRKTQVPSISQSAGTSATWWGAVPEKMEEVSGWGLLGWRGEAGGSWVGGSWVEGSPGWRRSLVEGSLVGGEGRGGGSR